MKVLSLNKREAGGLIGALLWLSAGYKLGKSQLSLLKKIFRLWPDLYEPEMWPELEEENDYCTLPNQHLLEGANPKLCQLRYGKPKSGKCKDCLIYKHIQMELNE